MTTTSTTLRGREAIAFARAHGLTLGKYADPTEGARSVSPDEAETIAREDPSLIFLQVDAGYLACYQAATTEMSEARYHAPPHNHLVPGPEWARLTIETLADAFGGVSQIPLAALGAAARGQRTNGGGHRPGRTRAIMLLAEEMDRRWPEVAEAAPMGCLNGIGEGWPDTNPLAVTELDLDGPLPATDPSSTLPSSLTETLSFRATLRIPEGALGDGDATRKAVEALQAQPVPVTFDMPPCAAVTSPQPQEVADPLRVTTNLVSRTIFVGSHAITQEEARGLADALYGAWGAIEDAHCSHPSSAVEMNGVDTWACGADCPEDTDRVPPASIAATPGGEG